MERRRVLTGIGAAGATLALGPALAACTSDSSGDPSATGSPTAGATGGSLDPRGEAAQLESDLLTHAANIQARWPATAAVLAPVQAAHAAHYAALVHKPIGPTPPADSSAPRLPGTAEAALRQLAAAERAAAAAHAEGAATQEGQSARLLASVAAYAAAQDVVLTKASTTEGIGR